MKERKPWKEMTEEDIAKIRLEKCVMCRYSAGVDERTKRKRPWIATCDYVLLEGHSRGVRPEDCEHWKEGQT